MRARPLLSFLVGALTVAALVGASTKAAAGRACLGGVREGGYSYAGLQATSRSHGVRATITMTRAPGVEAGHVAGWIGLGGPGQGTNGDDAWIQAGIAATPGTEPLVYAEITRGDGARELVVVEDDVALDQPYAIAVLEMAGRPGWWRVWVDGQAVTEPVRIPGSSGRWAPIATAESWNAGLPACNTFAFRFERVSVSRGGGGSWRPFVAGNRFLDGTNVLRSLRYAFVAASF